MLSIMRSVRGRVYGIRINRLAASALLAAVLTHGYPAIPLLAQPYQGFGANTAGGNGQPTYHVTSLNDSGPGSLRDALSQGNRYIVFDVAGVIESSSRVLVRGANITIDGFTAPSPGITLKNFGLRIAGPNGAHDVIVRGIRVQVVNNVPGSEDGITVANGSYNVVIDHVSVRGASDENIGIDNAHDVTVSWSILADPLGPRKTNMLISNRSSRISVHHNLFINGNRRNPWITWLEAVTGPLEEAPEIQADVRNNIMWHVSQEDSGHGALVFGGGKANIVSNYFKATPGISEGGQKRAIVVCKAAGTMVEDLEFCASRSEFPPGRAYVQDNVSADGWSKHINNKSSETSPFAAPAIDTAPTCTAAGQVLAHAGVEPPDELDQNYLAAVSLKCAQITNPVPGSVLPGPDVTFNWVANGANITEWRLYVGSTKGAKDLHDSGPLNPNRSSREVKKLPVDGRAIWVQLRFQIDGAQQFVDFQYTAFRK